MGRGGRGTGAVLRAVTVGGGVAYLGGLCNNACIRGAGTCRVLGRSVPAGHFQCDVVVVPHELVTTAIRRTRTTWAWIRARRRRSAPRTIMAYCGQTFTGGDANHDLWFHTGASSSWSRTSTRAVALTDCNRNGSRTRPTSAAAPARCERERHPG